MANEYQEKTIKELEALTKKGDIEAAYHLGMAYKKEGKLLRAIKYLDFASEKKNALASYVLGLMYFNGDKVRKNYKLAEKYFSRAAFYGIHKASYYAYRRLV